jgi:GDP-L-fucose synthase
MDFWSDKKILITGGGGFLGSHVLEKLIKEKNVKRDKIKIPRRNNCDLRSLENCIEATENIDIVIHLAANVGGIQYNINNPASLFYDNASMGIHLMEASRINGVGKVTLVGTVCSYPSEVPTPFKEEDFWKGYPEKSNAPYGIAKKILLTQSFAYREQYDLKSIYLIPINLYGPRDDFDPKGSHVIPALIRKIYNAVRDNRKKVTVWGSGKQSREFLYVKDAAEAIIIATEKYDKPHPVNIGTGNEIPINKLVEKITKIIGYHGEIIWDVSKPEGQKRRCLDTTRAYEEFGFKAKTPLEKGIKLTLEWYKNTCLIY